MNTTLVVVATNAVLTVAQAKRTATAAHAGMARALSPVHTLADGDTVFVLATGETTLDAGEDPAVVPLMELQAAAAEATRDAILDGIRCAGTVHTPQGDLLPWPGEVAVSIERI